MFKTYVTIILNTSSLEDIQNDSVNMFNVLEPISYFCMINYDKSTYLLIDVLRTSIEAFQNAQSSEVPKSELMKQIKQCCWAIIFLSEFIKKSQDQRVREDDTLKYFKCDALACSLVFYISLIEDIDSDSNLKTSLMIFFKAFTEAYFIDVKTSVDTTVALCDGMSEILNILINFSDQI